MLSATDTAHYFLVLAGKASGEARSISHLKLQKLLYYAQGYHLAATGQALFSEPIEAWQHGPVVKDLYHQYKSFISNSIPVPTTGEVESVSATYRIFLQDVFADIAHFSAWDLRSRTHHEVPWATTYDGSRHKEIPQELLSEYFVSFFGGEVKDISDSADDVLKGLLLDNRGLAPMIHFARRELNRRFGPDATMNLRGHVDPEEGDHYATLFVQTSLASDEATSLRNSFDEEWWFDRSVNNLVINTELIDV